MPSADGYIYLTQHYAAQDSGVNGALAVLNESKRSIMSRAQTAMRERQMDVISSLSEGEALVLEDMFEGGKMLTSVLGDSTGKRGDTGFPDTEAEISNMLSMAEEDAQDIGQFSEALDSLLATVEKEYDIDLQDYTEEVIKSFISNSRVGVKGSYALTGGDLAGRIIETLRGQYSGSVFQAPAAFASDTSGRKLSNSLGKLASLSAVLDSIEGQGYISAQGGDFWPTIAANSQEWLNQFADLIDEAGTLKGVKAGKEKEKTALQKMRDAVKNFHVTTGGGGGGGGSHVSVTTKIQEDTGFAQEIEKLDRQAKMAGQVGLIQNATRGGKHATAFLSIGDDGGGGTIGINAMDGHKHVGTNPLRPYHFRAMRSTNMMALLLREANMSIENIYGIINVGAALPINPEHHYTSDMTNEGNMASAWSNLKDVVVYNSVLSVLAGVGDTANSNIFFMSLGGSVYSVSSILEKIATTLDSGSAARLTSISGSGFERAAYQSLNRGSYQRGGRGEQIGMYVRSGAVMDSALRLMQNTKVDVMIDLANLVM